MNVKMLLLSFLLLFVLFPVSQLSGVEQLQIVFVVPDVGKDMDNLNWGLPKLKEWRRRPMEKVNNELDGKFNLTIKLLNVPKALIGETPRLKICPMPNEPNKCWEQDVLTPIDQEGVFKCSVYLRLSNWAKHIFEFKIGNEVIEIVIDEEKF